MGKDGKVKDLDSVLGEQNRLTDLEIWAISAYVISPDEYLLWQALGRAEGLTKTVCKQKAKTWLATDLVKKTTLSIIDNFNKGKKYVPVDVMLKMKNVKEIEEDDSDYSTNREEIMSILARRIKTSNGTDTEAIKLLANMEQWNKQKEEDSEDVQFNERIHLYIPITCDRCNRMGTPVCNGCSIQKEADDNLTEEERAWINENDSIG